VKGQMNLKVSSAKLTGVTCSDGWAQIHDFIPAEPEKLHSKGHLFAVISASGIGQNLDSTAYGREVLTRLHEEYYGQKEGSAYQLIKSAVSRVFAEFEGSWGEVGLAAVSVVGDTLFTACQGKVKTFLYRQGYFVDLAVRVPGFSSAIGRVEDGDMVICGTRNFFDDIPKGVLRAAIGTQSISEISEKLAPYVQAKPTAGSLAAVIVKFESLARDEDVIKKIKEKETSPSTAPAPGQWSPTDIQSRSPYLDLSRFKLARLLDAVGGIRNLRINNDPEKDKRRKTLISVGLIFLFLLLVSIFFGLRQKRQSDIKKSYESELSAAVHAFDEAVSLKAINEQRARELFVQSKEISQNLIALEVKDDRLEALKRLIEEREGEILGEYRREAELFVDLSLLSNGMLGESIFASESTVYVLDGESRKIASVEVPSKKTQVEVGPGSLEKPVAIAAYADNVFVLEEDGVYKVDGGRERIIDKDWRVGSLLASYAGNIYVLDKEESAILRYASGGGGFGAGKPWLSEGTEVDLKDVLDWAIDGSLWTLGADEVVKFSLGNRQSFSLQGVFPAIEKASNIYTDEESQYLYILEPPKNRVVVTDKEGKYKAQYLADALGAGRGVYVSENDRIMLVLLADKLVSISLDHLQ
jgi:hypothetical protein